LSEKPVQLIPGYVRTDLVAAQAPGSEAGGGCAQGLLDRAVPETLERVPKRGARARRLLVRRGDVLHAAVQLGRNLRALAAPLGVHESRFHQREVRDVTPVKLARLLESASVRERVVPERRLAGGLREDGRAERQVVVHRGLGIEPGRIGALPLGTLDPFRVSLA